MTGAIRDTLPLALGIAFNPLAILVSILMLCKSNALRNGTAFAFGWVLGLTLLLILSARIFQDLVGARPAGLPDLPAVIWIGLGALFLLAAARGLRNRSLPGEPPASQRWLDIIGEGGAGRAFGTGVFLSMVSLRNLALLAAAASVIGKAALAIPELAVAVTLFVAVSSLGMLIPLLVRLFGAEAAEATLEGWGEWLRQNMGTITAAVMALLGAYLLLRGLAGLF